MSFFLFIIVFLVFLLFALISFGLSVIRGIFFLIFPGLTRRDSPFSKGSNRSTVNDESRNGYKSKKKIFDNNEGDYAEFEEVK